ncbi:lipid-transfer protein [Nocardioides sp. YIM 152315]|uniref:thiolase C-terminal domain-containing protein n=1 Tax=Nocardioides sp. YIM 152315 TaxID=3031760 RepID=UPI0023DCE586|nr:lipid-transfer protein [Nocardioides sp. YIM 152315]MDF1602239.1 lipid-transfer protein [Nocardioides sp. YIM 152315]
MSEHDYAWKPDACAIAGIGTTAYTKSSGASVTALAAEAALAAIEDAGLEPADIDGFVRSDYDEASPAALADTLGIDDIAYWGQTGAGGAAPCAMVGQAAAAILSGQARHVVVYRALNGRSGRRLGQGVPAAAAVGGGSGYLELFSPWGMTSPGQFFAMLARRHMEEFGLTDRTLAEIAMVCRRRANANPAAMMHGRTMSLDDYLESRMIASPLRMFDFCLETDGAAAVVVTSSPRARDLKQRPALIRSVAQSTGSSRLGPGQMYPVLMGQSLTDLASRRAADRLYERAGLSPADVDVAQLYDCFTITVFLQLADYGFCSQEDAVAFVESGALDVGGALPINTAGGQLSESYIHGMNHIVEAVRQVRGTSTSQVPGAEVSLVTSAPPPGTSAMILVAS